MTTFDFDGQQEYRDVAARKTTAAPAGEPSVKGWAEALVTEVLHGLGWTQAARCQ